MGVDRHKVNDALAQLFQDFGVEIVDSALDDAVHRLSDTLDALLEEQEPKPLSPKRALDLAIFALNTGLHPDASSAEDLATLDRDSEAAILTLVEIRNRYETESAQVGGPTTHTMTITPEALAALEEKAGLPHDESAICTLTINVDVEPQDDDDEVQEQARAAMIDLLQSGCEIQVQRPERPDEIITSPSGWTYRSSQENGDQVNCQRCGKPLNDDKPIYTNKDGYAFDSEECILADHDEGETLHKFDAKREGACDTWVCKECGDTPEGLMHNNTQRSIEPLLWEGE